MLPSGPSTTTMGRLRNARAPAARADASRAAAALRVVSTSSPPGVVAGPMSSDSGLWKNHTTSPAATRPSAQSPSRSNQSFAPSSPNQLPTNHATTANSRYTTAVTSHSVSPPRLVSGPFIVRPGDPRSRTAATARTTAPAGSSLPAPRWPCSPGGGPRGPWESGSLRRRGGPTPATA